MSGATTAVAPVEAHPAEDALPVCPACLRPLDHLALLLDLAGVEPLACGSCGAVLDV